MPLVATQVKRRRGTGVENDAFAGAEGEITVDLTNKELRVHDGSGKLGGFRIGRHTDRSNCITEIPQDIKLELNNGTLTLKTGSKVYIPNGIGVFDNYSISSDSSVGSSGTYTGKGLIFYRKNGNILARLAITQVYSGSTHPATDGYWYNTTDNIIYWISGGTDLNRDIALPLAEVTVDNGTITSIDQVFNGFGYIGSTVFALPNVKGLIPNGRNADGSLKNIILTSNTVITRTLGATTTAYIGLQANSFGVTPIANYTYNEKENKQYSSGTAFVNAFVIAKCTLTSGVISNWQPKTAFHALDYNDTEYIGHQAIPSAKNVSLTLGTSGNHYTAPADGWFFLNKTVGTANTRIEMYNSSINFRTVTSTGGLSTTGWAYCSIPANKGDDVQVSYNVTGDTNRFCFIYANGAK